MRVRRLRSRRYLRRLPQSAGRCPAPGFPRLGVYPVAADFTAPFALPDAVSAMPKVGFFPGSTLGNFEPHEGLRFLRSAREILGHGAQMVIGVDLEKDERVLYEAYNDAAGVTARFNLNVLVASTANSAAISTSPASAIARSTIASATASKCI
jgi:uncharacterized SAM-dependent methyltransferase